MIPDTLVQVRMYPYKELAHADQQLLADASISSYVKQRGRAYPGVSLMVAEEDVERATATLSSGAPFSLQTATPRQLKCPYCGSEEIESRAYYAAIPLGAVFVIAATIAVRGNQVLALAAFGVGAAIATVVFAWFARARCRSCGRAHPSNP